MEILTLREVACELRLSKQTTAKLLRQGRLPGVRMGDRWRILPEKLNEFLQRSGSEVGGGETTSKSELPKAA